MKQWFRHSKTELIVYAAVWFIIFIAPLVSSLAHEQMPQGIDFSWPPVIQSWKEIGNFFFAFVLHDLFIAPIMVTKRKKWTYIACVITFIAVLIFISFMTRPSLPKPPMVEHAARHMPPPLPIDRHDLIYLTMLLIGVGFNTGIKGYFRWQDERERLEEIEKHSLAHQIDYLRYQVNPHFLMNTLNNIHALVDIDGEKAKKSIVMLSKLLRHILYEGSKEYITLKHETELIKYYVSLMKMRYDDRVKVTLDMSETPPLRNIAPLMFVVFIENAFKHGVSYKKESFVDIGLKYDNNTEKLTFTCRNSILENDSQEHGGIGLDNALRRLDLIYGDNYDFKTVVTDDEYLVTLVIPTVEGKTSNNQDVNHKPT